LLFKQTCTVHEAVLNHIFVEHQHHLLVLLALWELFVENLAQLVVAPEEDLLNVSQYFLRRHILQSGIRFSIAKTISRSKSVHGLQFFFKRQAFIFASEQIGERLDDRNHHTFGLRNPFQ